MHQQFKRHCTWSIMISYNADIINFKSENWPYYPSRYSRLGLVGLVSVSFSTVLRLWKS